MMGNVRPLALDLFFVSVISTLAVLAVAILDADPGSLALGGLVGYIVMDIVYTHRLSQQVLSKEQTGKTGQEEVTSEEGDGT